MKKIIRFKNAAEPAVMKKMDVPFLIEKADSETGTFSGYGSVFKNRDSYNEAVMPGAFVDSLVKHKQRGTYPLMLWQHQPSEVPGVWNDLAEDEKGLYAEGELLLETQLGKETHVRLKKKAIQGLSIGYREVDVEPATPDGQPRKLIKLDLLEISIVSFPANVRARVEDVKMWSDFAARIRAGTPPSIKEFEEHLREAGFPKALAKSIASVGYAKAVRCEAEGDQEEASAVASALDNLKSALDDTLRKVAS